MDREKFLELGYTTEPEVGPPFKQIVERAYERATELATQHEGYDKKWAHTSGKVKHLVNAHRREPTLTRILESAQVRQAVTDIFEGRPAFVTHSKISYKVAGIKQAWLPHQDGAYNPEDKRGITFAVFLEDCDKENGTLEVFPYSHKDGITRHEMVLADSEKEPQIRTKVDPKFKPFPVAGKQGTLLCFHPCTVHQSGFNSRGGNRCIFIFEVAELKGGPAVEATGEPAITYNAEHFEKASKPTTYARFRRLVIEHLIKPTAKKILYIYFHVFARRRIVATQLEEGAHESR